MSSNGQSAIAGREVESAAGQADERRILVDRRAQDGAATTQIRRGVRGKFVAFGVVALLILTGVLLAARRFSNRKGSGLSSTQQVDRKPSGVPLKFEKLTGNGQSRFVAISPDAKYLAYTSGFDEKIGIWLRQLATNTNVEIVPATGPVYGLAFANSGEYLYLVKGNPTALYRVSLLGGVTAKLLDRLEGNFSLSGDDSRIAFIRQVINSDGQREYSLMLANSDGSSERTLLPLQHPEKLDVPVWSPDDQSILCARGSAAAGGQDVGLIEIRISDGTVKSLSAEKFSVITKMAWLPDKSGLIISARKGALDNELWRVSYPGMELRLLNEGLASYSDLSLAVSADKAVASESSRTSNLWIGSSHDLLNLKSVTQAIDFFSWTPGGQLVYSSEASGSVDLWIMQPDGSGQKQLTVNSAANATPAITADNRYIVFISNRSGAFQVWRMNIDGSNQIQLTDGVGKNYPAVSPDGKWVLYNSTDDWHLWKVSIDGGVPSEVTDYVASLPAVSPDGKRIACIGRNESKRELLILPFVGGSPQKRVEFFGWVSRLQWTPDGRALIYAGEHNGVKALMKQFVNGDLSEEALDFDRDELFDFGYSFDKQLLAVTRGSWQHNIVLINDLSKY